MGKPSSQSEDDLDLMRRVARQDPGAVAELYDRFGSLVYRMAFQAMPTRADADDAVQEIFVRLWRTATRYDPKRAALVTWVMLLSRRHLVDKLRRSQARLKAGSLESVPGDAPGVGWSRPTLDQDERVAAVMKKVKSLPDLQQTVIIRAYLGGQTLRQIGAELNTPIGTIKSALSRALLRLRERSAEEPTA